MMKHVLICVAGRTAAGKSIITKKLAKKLGLKVVKSYKTGNPTPEDIKNGLENSDHIFISDAEFDNLQNIAAETEINGSRYCTTLDQLEDCDFYVIDPDGINDLRNKHSDKFHIVQFYIYADEEIRQKRYTCQRGQTEEEFVKRDTSERAQFNQYEGIHGYDIIIYNNGDIEEAIDTMEKYVSIIMKHRLKEIAAAAEAEAVAKESEKENDDEEDDEAILVM